MTITELPGDLFQSHDALCHCVSRDLKMGLGIALLFKNKFQNQELLKQQKKKVGQVAYLKTDQIKNPYIFYLITKEKYWNKPTMQTLEDSLKELKKLCLKFNITKLSMPRIGCGLDKLQWNQVKKMIENIFQDSGIKITVYYL